MVWFEGAGWLGAALTAGAYSMHDISRLRILAVGANLSFITFGLATAVWPMFALHLFLLPLNLFRLREEVRLAKLRSQAPHDGPGSRGISVTPSGQVSRLMQNGPATRRPGRHRGAWHKRCAASRQLPWDAVPQR